MRKFNLLWLFMMFFVINGFSQNGSVPELIYYKFNTVGTSVMNEASTPVGTNPAPITGLTIGSGGMLGTNGLIGTGQSSATNVINTGWNTDMTGDFTLAFWTSNVTPTTSTEYIFGDGGASSFRCFTGGVAGSGNWLVRGPMPDLELTGGATLTSNMMHVVYDATAGTLTGYVDGVQTDQVSTTLNVTGTGLTVGGYAANSGLNGVLDEFRWYDRALSPLEISNTYNVQLPLNRASNDAAVLSVDSPQVFCAGSQNIIATIGNYGGNQIDSVDVHWEIDGVAQPTFQYIGLLDTVNGSNPNTAQVTLGSYNFPSGLSEVKVYTSNPNGVADTVNYNDTTTVMVGPSLNGVYTVNSAQATGGTNYQSFGELINVLNTFGVCGPVTVDVVANSGPYNEVLAFENIPGSSSINTIRINGNGNTVEYANTSTDRQMLTLNGTQYLTIDSLNFKTLDATYGWGALITGGSAHDSIMNCEFDLSSITGTSSANSSGIVFSGSATSATTTGSNGSHCYIGNNYLKATTGSGGPYYGVVIAGSSDSNIVVNNTIENVYFYSMYVNGSTGSKIMYNDINRAGKTTVTTFYGIYTTGITAGVEIVGNRIHRPYGGSSSSTSTCYAMYLLGDGTASEPVIIANNLIYNINQGGLVRGIYMSTAPYNLVYHNTIDIDQNLSSSSANYGIYATGTNTGTEFKNNIVSITGGGTGDKYGFYYSTAASIDDAQKNNIYVNSTQSGTQYYGYYTTAYSTQNDFHAAYPNLEVNSPIEDPLYTNAATGNLKPTNSLLIGVGENLFSLVPEDITGRSRSLVPTIGAYEGELTSNDATVLSVDSPNVFCAGVENIVATIGNAGMNQLDSVEVHWEIDGVAQPSLNYTQLLDTAGGSNPRTAQVTLGSHNFQGLTEIKVWTSMPNGVADTSSQNDTVQVFVAPSLSGAYTVNAAQATGGSNYSSFGDLLNDLHGFGICGPITVDVAAGSGSYNEQVIFRTISGASATNTITINGNGETIEFAPSSADKRILGFDNASYINIKNLKIVGLDATYGFGIHFTNSSHNITIDSTEVDLTMATSTSSVNVGGIISSGSVTSMSTTGNNASNISITNSKVDGGTSGMYYGVRFNGNSTSDLDSLIRFENNEVANFYAYGIYLYHIKNSYVGGNDIHRADKQTVTTFYGIYTGGGSTNDTINANMIHNTHGSATSTTGAAYGFYSSSNDAEASAPNLFVNNLLYDFNSGSGTVYAIYNLGSDNQAYVNNTISLDHVDATGGTTRGFYQSTAASGITFANNNISITRGGTGIKHGLYFNTATSTITSDYNNIYLNSLGSGAQYVGRESGTDQATLANWQTTSYDGNSESVDPIFTDAIGGDLTPNEQLLNGTGFNYGVPVDFYGVARNNPPDIGAIEFEPANLNASISQVVSPSGGLCPGSINIILEVSNRGLLDLDSVSIYWDVNGVLDSMKYIGTINSNSSVNVTLPSLSFSSSQLYDLKFYTSWPNGLADERPKDDTLMLSALRTGFSGVYTLDPSQAASLTNYTSFDALTQDLSNYGICGPTTVNVAPGTYTDDLYISNIPGASSSNYLVIDGGDSSQTIISQGSQYASLTFDDVQHVKVMNMTIENTSTSGAAVIFSNGSRYDTLSNCVSRVDVSSTSSVLRNIVFSSSTTSFLTGADVNYNVIQNNRVIGGYYGFYLYGSTSNLNTYNQVLNNEIDSVYYYGMYNYYQDSLEVVGNSINMLSRANTNADGIYMINSYNPRVDANYVWAGDYGVYVSSGTGSYAASTRRAQFVNNMIYSESDYGLYLYYVDRADIWHNSIHVEGTVTPALQINASTSAPISEYDVRNNILSSVNTEALETSEPDTIFIKLDYNVYNSNGPVLINIDGTGYATLAGYQSVQPSFNTASLEGNPQFVSNTDLHILGSFVDGQADATLGITEDIDGDSRPMLGSTTVDIGADEFDPPSCPRPLNFTYYNSSIDSVTVTWDGDISAGDYEIEIVDCGDPQGSGTTSVIVGDSVTLGGLTPNLCYEIYVREICARGDTSLWADPFKFGLRDSCESFDNYVLGPVDEQSILIDGWDNAQGDAEVSNDYASSGSYSLKIHDSGPAGYSDVVANLDTYTSGKWNISIDFLIPQGNGGYYNILHNYLGGGGSVWAIETYLDASGVATVNEGSNGTGVIGTYNFTPGAWNSISHIIDLDNDTAYLLLNGVPTNVGWQFSLGAPNGNQFNAFNFFSAANAGQTPLMYFDNFCIKAFEEAPIDGAIVDLAAPLDDGLQCYTSTEAVSVRLINAGLDSLDFTVDTAEVTMVISGAASQTLSFTVSDNTLNGGVPLARGESIEVPLGTFDMSTIGTYYFDAIVDITADGVQTNDAYSDSITTQAVEGGMVSDNDSICAGDTTTIKLSSYYGAIQWQEFDGTAWVDIIGANEPTVDVDPMNTTEYRALVCGTEVSDTVEVYVTNIQFTVINNPTVVACDSTGTDSLIATSTTPGVQFTWYDAPVDGNVVHIGDTLLYTETPSSTTTSATDTFYVSGTTGSPGGGNLDSLGLARGTTCCIYLHMFKVHAITDMTITDMGVITNDLAVAGWDLYYRPGDYSNIPGANTSPTGWTLVSSLSGVPSLGTTAYTQIATGMSISLSAGDTASFYLVPNGGTFNYYTNATGTVVGSNSDVELISGNRGSSLFNATTNGGLPPIQLKYSKGLDCETPRQMVIGSVDCAVGLDDNSTVAGNIEVYPNPSNGLFTLNITTEQEENFVLSVRDVQGKLIYEENLTVNGAHRDDLDLVGLAKGVYYLQIQNDQATKVEKLIIQ